MVDLATILEFRVSEVLNFDHARLDVGVDGLGIKCRWY